MSTGVDERATFSETPIDRVRDYWNARPCNLRHSPATVGTRQYFDEVEARKYFVEPHIPGFAQFQRWSGKRVLEIGCGLGTNPAVPVAPPPAIGVLERSLGRHLCVTARARTGGSAR